MGSNGVIDYYDQALNPLYQCKNISSDLINDLWLVLYKLHQQRRFSEPMPTIGVYIALASLCCILAMVADTLHSWLNQKLWVPCKYFTLNAVSLTVIAVAMKLPMDLTTPMPGAMDQQAKLRSMVFMCIIMTYFLPSLATMNGKELVTNIIALGVLDLESKYQAAHERALMVQQQAGQLTVENLKQRVINYGIMAVTGSPQLMIVCSVTSFASAVICALIYHLHFVATILNLVGESRHKAYDSDYKWSILVIFTIQSIGITLGAHAQFYRFLAPLTFKPSKKGFWNLIKFYEVESLWTHTLSDWKRNRLYSSSSPTFRIVFFKLQILGLKLLTLSQKVIVMSCKAIRIIPGVISICVVYCFGYCHGYVLRFVKWLESLFGIQLRRQTNRDIRQYVLQPQDDMEVADVALSFIIISVKRSIQNAEKQQPSKLMTLLENSRDFDGVGKFDRLPVQSLPVLDSPNCWSLPVVTLATIALSLPNIQLSTLKNFLNGVSEGLVYVQLVEESLNNNDELVSVQRAAKRLWPEVEVYHKWLGNNLQDPHFRKKTAIQIVKWFKEKTVVGSAGICANSMRRVTQTMLLFYQNSIDEVSQEELFDELSSMISDILAACLTNLPQVIAMKCHTSVIEKREESVRAAATILGKTSGIIDDNSITNLFLSSFVLFSGKLVRYWS